MKRSLSFGTLLLGSLLGCARPTVNSAVGPRAALTAEDIERAPSVPLEQLLAAHVPGITLTYARDGRLVITIRGQSTLLGEQEPLVVVNGIPLAAGANLSVIDRHDIASIDVVKDAAGTALYGLRGANGVIVIRPKGA